MTTAAPTTTPSDPAALLALAQGSDRVALARLLSYVERGGARGLAVARLSYRSDVPYTLGLTGAPGAGKSTLTDRLITLVRAGWPDPHAEAVPQVGVLAIDPTSPFSGGAILGDRVRMGQHTLDPTVFIRSMATRGHLGGLSLAVPDAVRVLGAAGVPVVIVETVGVGQMEVEVASAADTTVVVVTPGWGDAMQANKAGLLEIADVFVINKADRPGAREARRDLEQMLDLSTLGTWRPPIVDTTATTGDGVDELWATIARHRAHLEESGELVARRADRVSHVLRRILLARSAARVQALASGEEFTSAVKALVAGELDPYQAADRLLGQ
jgi:LAO/AO transport system kinase